MIEGVPFTVTDWNRIETLEVVGENGRSLWRVFERGNLRVRIVEYSAGYKADHWCERGHILLVLEGELVIRLKDGREFALTSGMSFQASDDEKNPHLALTEKGARVFIAD